MEIDLSEVRRAAVAAGDKPWCLDCEAPAASMVAEVGNHHAVYACHPRMTEDVTEFAAATEMEIAATARWIALMDPPTGRELVDRAVKAELERDAFLELVVHLASQLTCFTTEEEFREVWVDAGQFGREILAELDQLTLPI